MDIPVISKAQAIEAFGGNAAALARALKITPSAVYQWPDGPIDERHALKLRFVLKPDVFGAVPEATDTPPAEDQEAA
ncbi:Cro/CI family transcriptional regulator [Marilutibacter alkalisoli]|uniref:Helix-turn-helix domain-containing protein n=1 Tax=Marilutibacter alkalisoli TaxID=2591633 RepID=A0A514BTX7_9GAMM|nr:Cro/CI family transcriptional regulator [Lysobacter alkalisoli]QDH70864.1 helix-turn-helix domain-containing protein [Lysobacter alkalisoli]